MELARDRAVFGGKKAAGCIQCELKTRGRTMAPWSQAELGAVASGGKGKHMADSTSVGQKMPPNTPPW